jgi:uncharacterized membrane protein
VNTLPSVIALLPWPDWAAVIWFFCAWIGYAVFARQRAHHQPSLLGAGEQVRMRWMLESTYRDPRVFDAVVLQKLASSPSFFASTTILIIGGLLAVLGSNEQATAMVRELPFAARTSAQVFDMKVLLLTGVFVYAFFRFTWSLRQYNFGALVVAALPDAKRFETMGEHLRLDMARRAAGLVSMAAESFNDGLRAYYMAFASVSWFFSPFAFMAATAVVVGILYQREFRSEALQLLHGDAFDTGPVAAPPPLTREHQA